MIKSMTGFAAITREHDLAAVSVTMKSVNHRYLDLQLRMPSSLGALEARMRALVQRKVARGRVEAAVSVQFRHVPVVDVEINETLVAGLRQALDRARELGHIAGHMTAGDLLRYPDALTVRDRAPDADGGADRVGPLVEEAVDAALDELNAMRTTEGGFLAADLEARRHQLGEMMTALAAAAEAGIEGLRVRIAERVRELRADGLADEGLVAQEIARFASRSDITEEVVRFRGHLDHWRALSDAPEPCGRKLDFLLQEMNREVNTSGSKAEGPHASELVVALKAELEKMREQVQNVE
jgi:uncharacterized protein (TIGR00255 family)